MAEPLLQVVGLRKEFHLRGGFRLLPFRPRPVHVALDDVSLTMHPGEVLSLIGESGSGKSTLSLAILRLIEITAGEIRYRGQEISRQGRRELKWFRHRAQMVFQDTGSSLNPSKTTGRTIEEALAMRGVPRMERAAEAEQLLSTVGLSRDHRSRLPHELSGGQRQRVGIARALAMKPELLIADEPVSALDVSLQAQILNLLRDLRRRLGLTLLVVSHDLAVVSQISDRIAVMYQGRIVELGSARDVLLAPRHPYTRALIDAVPKGIAGRGRASTVHKAATAAAPSVVGCAFAPRCANAQAICREVVPLREAIGPAHEVACHFAGNPP